ncbi:MAG: type 3 dihydrofolate reductase [Alphaproteobacteria bacterium]|nr:type 3 dihydrofolate reductase [Alphaproteobacteria bacterium]
MLTLIVAVADNGVIGRDGGLPWRLPGDLAHFKATTMGKPIVMGRKTWESLGRPLPGRDNIVVTRDPAYVADGAAVAADLDAALAAAGDAGEVMIIGGAEIYALALPRADRIHLTRVHASPEGDTHFPDLDLDRWREVAREDHDADGDSPAYSFVTLERAR